MNELNISSDTIQNTAIQYTTGAMAVHNFALQVGCTKVENSELLEQYLMVRVAITFVILKCD